MRRRTARLTLLVVMAVMAGARTHAATPGHRTLTQAGVETLEGAVALLLGACSLQAGIPPPSR